MIPVPPVPPNAIGASTTIRVVPVRLTPENAVTTFPSDPPVRVIAPENPFADPLSVMTRVPVAVFHPRSVAVIWRVLTAFCVSGTNAEKLFRTFVRVTGLAPPVIEIEPYPPRVPLIW